MSVKADFSALGRLGTRISGGILEGLLDGGDMIVDLGSQLAPVDTSELSKSGKVEIINKTTVQVSFGNGLPDIRAVASEFGNEATPAQPYLTPAAANIDVMTAISDAIIRALQ